MRDILLLVLAALAIKDVAPTEVTTLNSQHFSSPVDRTVNVVIPTEHLRFLDTCHLRTPALEDLDMKDHHYEGITDFSNLMHPCQIAMLINANMNGSWVLYAKAGTPGDDYIIELPFTITVEGIETTTEELSETTTEEVSETTPIDTTEHETITVPTQQEHRVLEAITFNASTDETIQIRIDRNALNSVVLSCQLYTPRGEVLELTKDVEYPGVVVHEATALSLCLVELTVSEETHGEWLLQAKEQSGEVVYDVEQPFEVHVTESVAMFPEGPLVVQSGKDVYLRLSKSVTKLESCRVTGPESRHTEPKRDERYSDTCAYILSGVSTNDSGVWSVLAEGTIHTNAEIFIAVEDAVQLDTHGVLTLTEGAAVSQALEPLDALYCQLRNPAGETTRAAFAPCALEIAAVDRSHAGRWTMAVAVPGSLAVVHKYWDVEVRESEKLNVILGSSDSSGETASLTCSMISANDSVRCKFVRPDAAIFLAQPGIGDGRYSYFGTGVTPTESGHYQTECGLFIAKVEEEDVGQWKCVLETGGETFARYVLVEGGQNPPDFGELKSSESLTRLVGQEAVLSCSYNAQIDYCWFRAPNGTVISLSPGVSTGSYEYLGAGLGAGECGVRIARASRADSGAWTCGVGGAFVRAGGRDSTATLNLTVHESAMVAMQGVVRAGHYSSALVLLGTVYDRSPVQYCRFVSPDGVGFSTSGGASSFGNYQLHGTNLSSGLCRLRVVDPAWSDHGAWTIAARLRSGEEVVATTQPFYSWGSVKFSQVVMWYLLPIFILLTFLILSIMCSTKKTRRWTAARVSAVRQSIASVRSSVLGKRPSGAPPAYDDAVDTQNNPVDTQNNSVDTQNSSVDTPTSAGIEPRSADDDSAIDVEAANEIENEDGNSANTRRVNDVVIDVRNETGVNNENYRL